MGPCGASKFEHLLTNRDMYMCVNAPSDPAPFNVTGRDVSSCYRSSLPPQLPSYHPSYPATALASFLPPPPPPSMSAAYLSLPSSPVDIRVHQDCHPQQDPSLVFPSRRQQGPHHHRAHLFLRPVNWHGDSQVTILCLHLSCRRRAVEGLTQAAGAQMHALPAPDIPIRPGLPHALP